MKIWNFGSINTDIVYQVNSIVTPGETISAFERNTSAGGKGLNQSVAIARSGSTVFHVGRIGPGSEGDELTQVLRDSGVDTSFVEVRNTPTGHAIIQVDSHGENSIVLFPGANITFLTEEISSILDNAAPDDWVLLQNETNCVSEIITEAAQRGLKVAFNAAPAPAPTADNSNPLPLKKLSLLIVNRDELETITGTVSVEDGLARLGERFPNTRAIVTLGGEGCIYQFQEEQIRIPAENVGQVVATTAAGDTFVGYFLAEFAATGNVEQALRLATRAAAISVTRHGAADSIPFRREMAVRQPRYSKEEFAERGDALYAQIRSQVEEGNHGNIVAIDLETEDFEVDASEIAACDRLEASHPNAQIWIVRIGSRHVRRFGRRTRRSV